MTWIDAAAMEQLALAVMAAAGETTLSARVRWDGPLAWICEACKTAGSVKREPLAGASTSAKFHLEWKTQ